MSNASWSDFFFCSENFCINVDIAMKASGHASVQMHKRYLDLQKEDVGSAFGTLEIVTGIVTREQVALAK